MSSSHFRSTDSTYTHNANSTRFVNLLDEIQNISQSVPRTEQIQNFDQFKKMINDYDFGKNTLLQQRSPKKMGKYSLNAPVDGQSNQEYPHNTKPKRVQSLQLPSTNPYGSQNNANYLSIIEQQLKSRASTHRSAIQQTYNLSTGLNLAYQVQTNQMEHQLKHQSYSNDHNSGTHSHSRRSSFSHVIFPDTSTPQESLSICRSSANSSRSFNGEQVNHYEIHQKLGIGGFSSVHLCIDTRNNKKYAIKIIEKKEMRKKLFRKNSFALADNYINNEIAILKKMNHPYIIGLWDVIQSSNGKKIYIVLDYCQGGFVNEVRGQNKNQGKYDRLLESQCKRYYKQLCLAIDYIHNVAKIAHRDIKPENILLSDNDIKLSDFGLGTQDIQVISKSGTAAYLAPQANLKLTSSVSKVNVQKGDIWAMGITLYVLLQGQLPVFPTDYLTQESIRIQISNIKDISGECKDFLNRCLHIDPQKRIFGEELLKHAWINVQKNQSYPEISVTAEELAQAVIKQQNKDILTSLVNDYMGV